MLKSVNHLKKNHDIMRVYRRGAYGSGSGLLSVKAAPNGILHSRAVVVVSKKIDKRAVVRNRIRRRLNGRLAEIWTTVAGGYDIVISVHMDLSELPTQQLATSLNEALSRARVIVVN